MEELPDLDDVLALPNGAQFHRADMHIHSLGGSHDVGDAAATPSAIVASAIRDGLRIIAITDHNGIANVEPAITAATAADLLVVPGIELSTSSGHLLCYLPSLDALRKFHSRLTIHLAGTADSHCQEGMADCLDQVQALGGFGVLAHVDGPKGLDVEIPTSTPHKRVIVTHPALLAIELKNHASAITFCPRDPDGGRASLGRARDDAGVPQLARVVNSDAHTLAMLGRNAGGDRKVTRLKMQTLTFEALKLALQDADARVRIEEEVPKSVAVVTGLRLTGGFLKDQKIHFSDNLNCIIGGRGTGKSTMFEALRCFSPHPGDNPVVDSDVWPDRIDAVLRDEAGQTHHLARSRDDFAPHNVLEPVEGPDKLQIECYGQGETQKISQRAQTDPSALLEYLDRFVDVREQLAAEETARAKIIVIDAKIVESQKTIDQIPHIERELSIKRQQLKKLDEGDAKGIIEATRQLQQERQLRTDLLEQAKTIRESLDYTALRESVSSIGTMADPAKLKVGATEFAAIQADAATFAAALDGSEGELVKQAQVLGAAIKASVAEWARKEQALLTEIDSKKKAIEASGLKVDTAYIARLAQDEAKFQAELVRLKGLGPQLDVLKKERATLVQFRWKVRGAVSTRRTAFAVSATKKLRTALTDLNVTLKFDDNAHSPDAARLLIEVMGWRTLRVPKADYLTGSLTVPKLIDAIQTKSVAALVALRTDDDVQIFARQEAVEIINRMGEIPNLNRLETVQVFDRPKLTVTRTSTNEGGTTNRTTREFSQLSLGQQQSVLLALMLSSDSRQPLLIDQPEDNLDSGFIYSTLVPVLRMEKERRQIIVVTHNANIAVLGDAEQIIVLKANNEMAKIVSAGSIDDGPTNTAACNVLEGATAAFTRRARIYGLP